MSSTLHPEANKSRQRRRGWLGVALGLLLFATNVAAAPARVEDFDTRTWSRLLSDLPRPAVVVFSATYCAVCPEAIAMLANTIEARRLKAPLVAVVMDGEGRSGLLREAHYARVDRLFVFRGQEAAVRYAVNTQWRGVTPLVVLLGKSGTPVFITGVPPSSVLESWAQAK